MILLALVHLLVPDDHGHIPSQGRRFNLACDKPREYLATMTNQEAATGDVRSVNCPECIKAAVKLGICEVFGTTKLVGSDGNKLKVG